MKEPADKYFGVSMSEWISSVPNELEIDDVGLWQIIPVGIDSFNLSGKELEKFAKSCIVGLLEAGGIPVLASEHSPERWVQQIKYGEEPNEIACNIYAEYLQQNSLATIGGLWFSKIT